MTSTPCKKGSLKCNFVPFNLGNPVLWGSFSFTQPPMQYGVKCFLAVPTSFQPFLLNKRERSLSRRYLKCLIHMSFPLNCLSQQQFFLTKNHTFAFYFFSRTLKITFINEMSVVQCLFVIVLTDRCDCLPLFTPLAFYSSKNLSNVSIRILSTWNFIRTMCLLTGVCMFVIICTVKDRSFTLVMPISWMFSIIRVVCV